MKKTILLTGVLLLFVAKVYSYDAHDFQIWNTEVEEMKLNDSSKLVFDQEFRWGDNASELYYQHYDAGYVYLLNKYFNLGGGFRYVKQKTGDKFRDESEPYIVSFLYAKPFGFDLSNRTRIEYRYFDYQKDSWRFRNKFDMKLPFKFTKFEIQPIFADEVFFKFNGFDFNENRFYAGFVFNLTKNIKGEICYMLRSTKNTLISVWTDTNVLTTKLKLSF
ncbi:MAG: DUF2490 domain-containing protein [Candidatus Omnitrophica bacterium]|nr:DUF2490 domain-containing protein [Candidatus Omnitrophota bacterium]